MLQRNKVVTIRDISSATNWRQLYIFSRFGDRKLVQACIRQTELESTLPLALRSERQPGSDKSIGSNKDLQQSKLNTKSE
jgi:hypothetical protein